MVRKAGNENILVPLGVRVSSLNGILALNDSATYLWELLSEELSLEELCQAVVDKFNVPLEVANEDVQTFLNEISKLGLLDP